MRKNKGARLNDRRGQWFGLAAALALTTLGCSSESGQGRSVALFTSQFENDTTPAIMLRQNALLQALTGNGDLSDYVSADVHMFGLSLLDPTCDTFRRLPLTTASLHCDTEAFASDSAHRVAGGADNAQGPTVVIRRAIAGMPAGVNSITTFHGHPVVTHWGMQNGSWAAMSLQVYPPSPERDSLLDLLGAPRLTKETRQ